jgi:hypothetical protein
MPFLVMTELEYGIICALKYITVQVKVQKKFCVIKCPALAAPIILSKQNYPFVLTRQAVSAHKRRWRNDFLRPRQYIYATRAGTCAKG